MIRARSTQLCGCGCGKTTWLAPRSSVEKGWVKGEPQRYLAGHCWRARAGAPPPDDDPRWAQIIDRMAAHYGVSVTLLRSRNQTMRVGHARVQTYCALHAAGASHCTIGRLLGRSASAVRMGIASRQRVGEMN